MKIMTFHLVFPVAMAVLLMPSRACGQASTTDYLRSLKTELQKKWPENRTINVVFHGHSVPSGYFRTPEVHTLEAYPHQVLGQLKALYPTAVINVITTSIGGENSEQGEKRFKRDVLTHHPDVLFIDYALNDRRIGLEKAKRATERMIRKALKKNIPVILLTPSPDLTVDLRTSGNALELFARQLRDLAREYNIGLADSYARFKDLVDGGADLGKYMAQSNHPNMKGHAVIANEIMKYFR